MKDIEHLRSLRGQNCHILRRKKLLAVLHMKLENLFYAFLGNNNSKKKLWKKNIIQGRTKINVRILLASPYIRPSYASHIYSHKVGHEDTCCSKNSHENGIQYVVIRGWFTLTFCRSSLVRLCQTSILSKVLALAVMEVLVESCWVETLLECLITRTMNFVCFSPQNMWVLCCM